MNEDCFYDLSETEMLTLWKRVHRLEDLRHECVIEREDGIDLDAYLTEQMRRWYAELLLTAPSHLLPIEDLSNETALTVDREHGFVVARPPLRYVRPVEWRLSSWVAGVRTFAEPDSDVVRRQATPWLRAGTTYPVVADYGDRLLLYGIDDETPVLATALSVVKPSGGRYRFHISLLPCQHAR